MIMTRLAALIGAIASCLTALPALSAAAAELAAAEDAAPPDNNVFYSLIRTETANAPPIGWARLAVPATFGAVPSHGFYADAFFDDARHSVVIAFGRLNPIPLVNAGTYDTDALILRGVPPTGYEHDVHAFLEAVAMEAARQTPPLSTDPDRIFVTGNSLGAYGAQVAAREHRYRGVGFAGPGIPGYHAPAERDARFVNYLIYGDPVANHATDTGISWASWPNAAAFGDHYGRIERLGEADDQLPLQLAVIEAAAPPADPFAALASAIGHLGLGIEIGLWHMSPRYKTKLGIETLPQPVAR
jgi:hypothetical protein